MKFLTGIAMLWKRQWIFYVLSGGLLLVLGTANAFLDKGWLVDWFDSNRTPFLDTFFKLVTFTGSGWFIAAVILLAGLVRVRNVITLTVIALSTGVIVQFLKRIVFHGEVRPSVFFERLGDPITGVDGIALMSSFSFPSGHAAGAFALFLGLALLRPGPVTGTLCFVAATLAALSRVYLAQHFSEDVFFGAVIGIVACSLLFAIAWLMPWYRKRWAGYSLLGIKQGPF
jgi:membrane-associated phospholipid phosphatase